MNFDSWILNTSPAVLEAGSAWSPGSIQMVLYYNDVEVMGFSGALVYTFSQPSEERVMRCPRCDAVHPDFSRSASVAARPWGAPDASRSRRRETYAVQPAESVTQFALISTILPHANRRAADGYRWALLLGGALVLLLAVVGLLPAAIVAGALLVPATYVIYPHDFNL